MMKKFSTIFFGIVILFSCNQNNANLKNLENQVQELKDELANTYKPGFGEIMGKIQTHHLKLWYAGKNHNWKLATFEIHELKEGLEDIEKYQKNRQETAKVSMIQPALTKMEKAIQKENLELFETNYQSLTNSCNACHKVTNYGFIKIIVPKMGSNQAF